GNAEMELRETPQKIEMMLAPGDDVVEVVAGGDGGAGHQQQDFIEPVHDPARLPFVRKLGKMLQKQRQTRSGRIIIRTCDREVIHGRAPAESERLRNHAAPSMQNHRSRAVNLTSEPWGFPFLLFRLQVGFTVPPWLTFPEAPL